MIEIYLLLGFIVIGAIIAIESRNLMSSVVALSSVGLALCAVYFMMRATEVAIVQMVAEIFILIVLVRVTEIKDDLTEPFGGLREAFSAGIIFVSMLAIGAVFITAMKGLPEFGKPLMTAADRYFMQTMDRASSVNLVNAVLLDYRTFDVLAAVAVLFAAVIGVYSVLRIKGRKKQGERDDGNN